MEADFAKWYTDIVKKADLATYSSVLDAWSSSLRTRSGEYPEKSGRQFKKKRGMKTSICPFSSGEPASEGKKIM